jgi:hypothetical protein
MADRSKAHDRDQSQGTKPPADDGVDVTLIRWMLSLTPRQRLQVLQRNINSILRLRDARTGTGT